ncbi:MAG: immunoglobulin domain-containing protein [Chloroflexota bacterium]
MRLLTRFKIGWIIIALFVMAPLAYSQTTTYIDEGFESTTFPPTGWKNVIQSGPSSTVWNRVTTGGSPSCSPYAGSAMARYNSYSASSGTSCRLTTPAIDFSSMASNTVSFYMYRDNGYQTSGYDGECIDVYVDDDTSIVNGARLLGRVNRAINFSPSVSANGWYNYSYTIPDSFLIEAAYIHFKAISKYGNNMYMDAVLIQGTSPIIPDASISAITLPTQPYSEGTYPISATLKNSGSKGSVKSATVHWSVNGVEQPPVNWSGKLSVNQTADIALGNYNLTFGPDGPWDPFSIRVWATNINGAPNGTPDADPNNDVKTSNASPTMDDAGITAISQPTGKFGTGVHDIYVNLKNYSRKPLTSVKIGWSIDGVEQTPKTWFGTLSQNQTAEALLGTFDFQFEKPIKSNMFKTWVIEANGKADLWTSNNSAPDRYIAPALVPGTYSVGKPNSHFAKLADMANYVSVIGVVGAGGVTFNIEPGVYDERIKIENTEAANNVIIRSSTGSSADVTWQATPTMSQPYSILLNNANNITVSDINFRYVEPSGFPAFVIAGSGVNGLKLNKNIFNGVAGSTQQFALVSITNSKNVDVQGNQFLNGSYQLSVADAADGQPVNLLVKDNLFSGFTRQGVLLEATTSTPTDKVEISKNTVMNNKLNRARTAFEVRGHSATITKNTLENLSAVHSPGDINAGIKVTALDAGTTVVSNNEVNNVENVNGIYVTGPKAVIRNNKVLVSSSADAINGAAINYAGGDLRAAYNEIVVNSAASSNAMSGIKASNASGYIADNAVVGNNATGAMNVSNNGINYIYNTFNLNSDANAVLSVNGGSLNASRNIFVNRGKGKAFDYSASPVIAGSQNNFYTIGTDVPNDITRWKDLTNDQTSVNLKITFNEEAGTKLGRYVDAIVFNTPLALPADVDADFQKFDFLGNERTAYWYSGSNGMNLSIAIIEQPKELLECEGSTNLMMKVVAQVTGGAETSFQWYKDGQPIPGETKSVYRIPVLTKENTGIYRCHVYGPANVAQGLDTKDLVVYTLGKTSIVRQDESIMAGYGENATLSVEAHIKGITAPFFQQKYQWYKRVVGAPDVKLSDGDKFTGTNTPKLFIKNIQGADYYDGSLGYVLEVEGQCGKVFSKPINLVPKPGITFNKLNADIDQCASDQPVAWEVDLDYFGQFDKVIIEHITDNPQNPKYGYKETIDFSTAQPQNYTWGFALEGPTSSKDNQIQKTRVTMLPSGQVWETPEVSWTFHDGPTISTQPQDVTVEEEKEFALTVEATSDSPMLYQWYKDGEAIANETNKTLYVASAAETHKGTYVAIIKNDCDSATSQPAVVTVTPKGIKSAIDGSNGVGIVSISPNPASEAIEIGYASAKSGLATFKVLELSGRETSSFTAESGPAVRYVRPNLTGLASGSYFLVMEIGGARYVERFVIVK